MNQEFEDPTLVLRLELMEEGGDAVVVVEKELFVLVLFPPSLITIPLGLLETFVKVTQLFDLHSRVDVHIIL